MWQRHLVGLGRRVTLVLVLILFFSWSTGHGHRVLWLLTLVTAMRLILLFAPTLAGISTFGPCLVVLILLIVLLVTALLHILALALRSTAHHVHETWGHLTLHASLLEHVLKSVWVNLTAKLLK